VGHFGQTDRKNLLPILYNLIGPASGERKRKRKGGAEEKGRKKERGIEPIVIRIGRSFFLSSFLMGAHNPSFHARKREKKKSGRKGGKKEKKKEGGIEIGPSFSMAFE